MSGAAPTGELVELNILIEGDDPRKIVCVTISSSEKFATLSREIQATYRAEQGISILSLELFKVNVPPEQVDHIQLSDDMFLVKNKRVVSVWPSDSSINDDLIHIVVRCEVIPSNTVPVSAKEETAIPPDEDELHELAERFKKTRLDFIKSVRGGSAASVAPKNFRAQQKTPNYIRNGRPAKHTGLPIVLYHPVFGNFLRNLRSTDPLPATICTQTTDYFPVSQGLYESEADSRKDRDPSSRNKLADLLGGTLERPLSNDVGADGISTGTDGSRLIIMEMKNEIGPGGSDPSIQAAQSYSRYWSDPKARSLLEKCRCPMILVVIAGPWMCVLGALFLERPVIQTLTHYLWVGNDPSRPSELGYIARVFQCISMARNELADFYSSPLAPVDGPALAYPYITHYTDSAGQQVKFTYLKDLCGTPPANGGSVFLAKTLDKEQPRHIVVKFVQSYNGDAHKLLAKEGLAPQLLYDGTAHPEDQPGPDHTMIVMELVSGVDLQKFHNYPLPVAAVKDIDKALEVLHQEDFVFGDLRNPNVMIVMDSSGKVTGAKLIDFDWCGKHQKGRYPLSMNMELDWAEGVGPGQ